MRNTLLLTVCLLLAVQTLMSSTGQATDGMALKLPVEKTSRLEKQPLEGTPFATGNMDHLLVKDPQQIPTLLTMLQTRGLRKRVTRPTITPGRPGLKIKQQRLGKTASQVYQFQEGVNGYHDTHDVVVFSFQPDTSDNGPSLFNDIADNHFDHFVESLLKFENVIGHGPHQIPPGAKIKRATLRLEVYNSGSGIVLHRVLKPWNDTSTWRQLPHGPDRYLAKAEARLGRPRHGKFLPLGPLDLDVTTSLRAWVEESQPNHGWLMKAPTPGGTNSVGIRSSQFEQPTKRPLLIVELAAPVPPLGTPIPPPAFRLSPKVTEISEDRHGGISIVAARWGAYNGWVDVTERVRTFLKDGRLVIPHVPDSLGQLRDPAFGHHKALVVVYRQGRETHLAIVPSQGKLNLPEQQALGQRPDVNVVEKSDPQAATALVGITRDKQGQIGLVKVNTATGKATPVLRVPVGEFECYSLTYHAPSGRFLTVSVESSTLGIFDPQLETFTKVAIVGLPAGQEKVSGIAYQQNKDRILIGFGPSGTNHENRIAQIDLQGRVLRISADLGLSDRDFLSWHPRSGDLLAIDFNGSSPRIAAVVDPFGKLSTLRFGNPPRDSQLTDLAVMSQQGRMFTIRQNTGELVEVIDGGKRFSTIGRFQTKAAVVGIAAAAHDWPAPLLGKRPRTSSLKPAADSLKEPVFESVLGVYGQAIRGQRFPFVNLRPPNRNLWTKEIENKLRGTLSYGQVDYSGTAKLVIPATGTYTIDLPARGTELRFNGILLKPADVQLQKGVYDVEIYTNHWGQPFLKYAHANVYKQGTRTKIPFVNTAAAIEAFRSQKIDSRQVIEVCDYDLKRIPPVTGSLDNGLERDRMTAAQLALGDPVVNSIGMKLVLVPAGQFQMGSPDSDGDAIDREKPRHQVKITNPFYVSVCEVTQQQYVQVMDTHPWQGKDYVTEGADYPATYVRHDEAVEFCRRLSKQEGVPYRLPTEAEWEYACRGGTTTIYSFGDDASTLGQYAWYRTNAWDIGEKYGHRVGQKLPNPWGLYDMHGNVYEWCQDGYGRYSREKVVTDPIGSAQGDLRLLRGGAFNYPAKNVRSASRNIFQSDYRSSDFGFRVVRTYSISP